jgi:aminotransferase
MDLAFRAVLNPGDEVIYHEPCYVSYAPGIALAGGVPVAVACRAEDGFSVTAAAIERASRPAASCWCPEFSHQSDRRNDGPRGIGKNRRSGAPARPAGHDRRDLRRADLRRRARQHRVAAGHEGADDFSARLFQGLRHDRLSHRLRLRPRGGDRGHDAHSPILDVVRQHHQPGSRAGSAGTRRGDMVEMREQYRLRRNFIVNAFNDMGLPCHLPRGSFYAFPNIRSTGLDSRQFALQLLESEKVACVPGSAFGPSGEGFVRCCFATALDRIEEAVGAWRDSWRGGALRKKDFARFEIGSLL